MVVLSLEFVNIYVFLITSLAISFILLFLSYILSPKLFYNEKSTSYECGFDPFGDLKTIEVSFCVVGILFLIFDLEIAFMFPWAISLRYASYEGFVVMLVFLFVLTIGFVYEWNAGALNWSKLK